MSLVSPLGNISSHPAWEELHSLYAIYKQNHKDIATSWVTWILETMQNTFELLQE